MINSSDLAETIMCDAIYLTPQQISHYLQIKISTIYAWVAQGKIPFIKIHGVIRFQKDEIDCWVETFRKKIPQLPFPLQLKKQTHQDINAVIARAKQGVYNAIRGETKPESAQRKEIKDGAV
jgi:excisionase family DNA binding protein